MLEADYSHALQLLLKYPAPEAPHGPQTFVDDALYLKDHYNAPGGSSIIMKYTGKMPAPSSEERPVTPESKFQGLSIRSRGGVKSPLRSPARFIQQRGGVEALFQGAAKGVLERGERLGINQAVRDAMGEIRRNMKDLSDARIMVMSSNNNSRATTPTTARQNVFTNGPFASPLVEDRRAVLALEHRNKQLSLLLEEAVTSLQQLAASNLEGDKEKNLEAVEMAAAKAHFVKIHLEDSSLDLSLDTPAAPSQDLGTSPQVVIDDALPTVVPSPGGPAAVINDESSPSLMIAEDDEIMTDSEAAGATTPKLSPSTANLPGLDASPLSPTSQPPLLGTTPSPLRPAPIPTRSTLARSSFSLMLEPDQTSVTSSAPASAHSLASSNHHNMPSKRPSNAFLFGEVVTDDAGSIASGKSGSKGFTSDDIFGLEPLRRPSKVRGKYEDLFGGALSDNT